MVDPGEHENVPRLFEAHARDNYVSGRWLEAVDSARLWLEDQPFSSSPASLGAHALHLLGRDDEAVEQVSGSLDSNPNDPGVLNSLMYYQILSGDLPGANAVAMRLASIVDAYSSIEKMVVRATMGLLSFRSGRPDLGRRLYAETVAEAKNQERPDIVVNATANLAREEFLAGNLALAEELIARARDGAAKLRNNRALEREIVLAESYFRGRVHS
jgi:hypothetical protein